MRMSPAGITGLIAASAGLALASVLWAQPAPESGKAPAAAEKKPDFPPFKEVSDGFEQVNSSSDGSESFYGLWKREKDHQLLMELPRNWQNGRQLISVTVPEGEIFAGLQMGEYYTYWKRIDKRLALVMPNVEFRSTGDRESKESIKTIFTDRVLVDVPIVCMGPNGQPMIDADDLFADQAGVFYGPAAAGANTKIATVAKAKAFPQNIELAFTVPDRGGVLKTMHYSISAVPENSSYQPRVADERIGYFTTEYRDLGKFVDDEIATRYINRWHFEKADPKLKLSPPKEPLIYYVEHTVPVRYRRYVREGVLAWNKAFEKVGIKDAIEVYYQDKTTGAHMDKDPEDVRYNFIRWLNNDIGTAIGPSRAHPLTGQILDADIILTDGWIRHFWYQANEYIPQVSAAMEGYDAETLAWLEKNPSWDPRLLLVPAAERDRLQLERAKRGVMAYGGKPIASDPLLESRPEFQRLSTLINPKHGLCMAADGKAREMALMGLTMDVMGLLEQPSPPGDKPAEKKDDKKDEKKEEVEKIDGIPEWFVGPALAELTAHELGHTLGLRHNFKGSAAYDFKEINAKEFKDRSLSASVMDYVPLNINMEDGAYQGMYNSGLIGPYDVWAIEYGYTFGDTKEILKRVNEPELAYQTDEDTGGPDPLARRYDHYKNPLDYSRQLMKLSQFARSRIIDKFVKDGETWAKARRGYNITLGAQSNAVNIMANWIGGSFINRDRKGDPGNRAPIEPVPAAMQREALKFVVENSFKDEAFGLTPELIVRLTANKNEDSGAETVFNIHDRISGTQASVLTSLMNPTRLRRVFDNEITVPADQDALTLPELLDTVTASIWTELSTNPDGTFTNRKPMISSFRRNLQNEHLMRLIDLSLQEGSNAGGRAIGDLATATLRDLASKTKSAAERNGVDGYTKAHLNEAHMRITKALDASYTYNAKASPMMLPFFFGQPTDEKPQGQSRSNPDGE